MKKVGIICEYNPFHNGHIYHIQKTKKLFPNSIIILVLSGYFTQRGNVSILTKEEKTKISLANGVDLVIELPSFFGVNSSDYFADASVSILNILKCDYLVFGSELNNIKKLTQIAQKQIDEDSKSIKNMLKKGLSYPASLNNEISTPNDLLGIAYIKSIIKINSNINPISIKRSNDYHDLKSNEEIISASNIRNKFIHNDNITKYLPNELIDKIKNINTDLLFNILKYKINTDPNLNIYLSVNEGIENRLIKYINQSKDISEFIGKIKTKRYTHNRLNRMIIHILLGISKEEKRKITNIEYIRILGFNKNGKSYLN